MNRRQFGLALALAGSLACAGITLAAADTTQIPSPNGNMVTEIFMPTGKGPFPVVIFSHGRAGEASERARLSRPIGQQIAAYWLSKGFAVVAPIRPGYGPSGGFDAEDHGQCTPGADLGRTASGAATAILAAVNWVRQQPWARGDRILLQGQSVGGLGTVAAAARNPPGVIGYINFAGGTGGNPKQSPGVSCHPEILTSLYGQFGSSTRIPGIWFYAANDEYWGPQAPRLWGQAYDGAGGHATLVYTGPVPNGRGHSLLNTAPQLWEAQLNGFLRQHGFR
jgi:dienelactone hydrolase